MEKRPLSAALRKAGFLSHRDVSAVVGPFSFLRDVYEGRVEARKVGSALWIRISDLRERVDPVCWARLSAPRRPAMIVSATIASAANASATSAPQGNSGAKAIPQAFNAKAFR